MSAVNSFDSMDTLDCRQAPSTRCSASTRCRATRSSPSASRSCSRTCCAPRTARTSRPSRSEPSARGSRRPSPTPRSSSRPRASSCRTSPACPASSTSPPCARPSPRSAATRTRSTRWRPPSSSSTTPSSPTSSARQNALERNVEIEYERNGERYQFLRWGQTAFDDFKVVPPGNRHRAPGQHRAPREGHLHAHRRRRAARLPRHLRRHRLAHHDGQRPRRARLGRRRHRGRGRDARPARVDAHPQGRRLQALRRDPHRRHRDRRRAHDHRDAAQARRRRQVRRVLRRGRRRGAAREPRHHRQHEPRVRLDGGDVPHRRRHPRLPAPHRPQREPGRARRGVLQAAVALARPEHRAASSASTSSSTSPPSCPRSPARSARRTASSSPRPSPPFETDLVDYASHDHSKVDAAVEGTFPASDPIGLTPQDEESAHELSHRHRSHSPATASSRPSTSRSTAPSSPSTTVRSRSRRSPRAPTPRTPRSCSPPGCSPATRCKKGLKAKPWVKTTLAPGSKVVTDYYEKAGLTDDLEALGFYTVGYGCTTCIGNSGPLARGDLGGDQRERPRRHRGALGQPQLRGPHQPRREDELPREPAARHRLRARRLDELRLREGCPRHRHGRRRGLPQGHLARRGRGAGDDRLLDRHGDVRPRSTPSVFEGDERWRSLPDARRAPPSSGTRSRPTCASPRTSTA